jgi:hypothetical protein
MTNRRRINSGDLGKEEYETKPGWKNTVSFAFPTDATITCVLKDYTTLGELVADAI